MVRRVLKTLLWVVVAIVLLPALLYVPMVQDALVPFALRQVSSATGMQISMEHFRLSWPLKVRFDGLLVVPAPGDTMVRVGHARLQVEPLPLLGLDIRAKGDIDGVRYRMGALDSMMYLEAAVKHFELSPSAYNLKQQKINLSRGLVDGADITLYINSNDTTTTPVDTAAPSPLTIEAKELLIRNVHYRMAMMPTIDSLDVRVPEAQLKGGRIDLLSHTIHAQLLRVDSVAAAYFTPSLQYLAEHPSEAVAPDTVATPDSTLWTITSDAVRFTGRSALYAAKGAVPTPGLDVNYLRAYDITVDIDSFYNRGASIRVPLTHFAASERCGVKMEGRGVFQMDSTAMYARGFDISTIFSKIKLDAMMGLGDMTADPTVPVRLTARADIGLPDIGLAMPSLSSMLQALPQERDLRAEADINGTVGNLTIKKIAAAMRDYFDVNISGRVASAMKPDHLDGYIDIDGSLPNLQFAKEMLLDKATARTVGIPPIDLSGRVDMSRGVINGDLSAHVASTGDILLTAMWDGRFPDYSLDLNLDRFPVNSFLPTAGVGEITATLSASGHGLDVTKRTTSLKADARIASAVYNKKTYNDLTLSARLDTGRVDARVLSLNRDASFNVTLGGTLRNGRYDMELDGDVFHLDLQALGLTPDKCKGEFTVEGTLSAVPDSARYDLNVGVSGLDWHLSDLDLFTPQIDMVMHTTRRTTSATLSNGGLRGTLDAACGIDTLLARLGTTSDIAAKMFAHKRIAVDTLQRALPVMRLDLSLQGSDNLLTSVLNSSEMAIKQFSARIANDSLMTLDASVVGIRTGDTRIDTVTFNAAQHGSFMIYRGRMNNRPGTFDDFAHVGITGYLSYGMLSAFVDQQNIKGETGFKLGATVASVDSAMTLRLTPLNPVIGYKDWKLNADNYLTYSFTHRHLDANLHMATADDGANLDIYTMHDPLAIDAEQENVIVKASGIQLADWLSLSPFAPPIQGVAGADITFAWDEHTKSLTGDGSVTLDQFTYGGENVGSFKLDMDVSTNTAGVIHANTALLVDGVKVVTAVGALNDSTQANPFDLDFSMIHLPLKIVNPFLPPGTATMRGSLNGSMCITGTPVAPLFNGYVSFDSAAVNVGMIGSTYTFSTEKIPVDSNVVRFTRYAIKGMNNNPLYVDGTVDMRNIAAPKVNLAMEARNMQFINSKRSAGSDVYGKGFVDVDATVKGNLDFMRVNARLELLPGSNVTYVMGLTGNDLSTLGPTDDNMVRFVQFSDTSAVFASDTIARSGMAMLMETRLIVDNGTTIGVDISPDGSNRAQIQGAGDLTFTLNPFSDMRLAGRYTLERGFVRYTPPLMSEKLFNFASGSYVAFNGDMMNPILNIHATDELKSNVTEEGQNSRLVNFLVSLGVTGTLEDMDVAFDLSTDDDMTIQNELQSMSQSQRANQAMNMLLYNMYTGPGTKASANLTGNPLFAFLTSRLNSWMANTVKGVDISFGIDQYNRTYEGDVSTATNYSYKVSKSLFDDRVKIVVGGNYSTDANSDENLSQNLINDISFEYLLNSTGTMYVRLFRHMGYESILEGEVTQTGVGFVYKRKIHNLRELFMRQRRTTPQPLTDKTATR